MDANQLDTGEAFEQFSSLVMNRRGEYLEPGKDLKTWKDAKRITPASLPTHLRRQIILPTGVTDVFVWVHGWRNDISTAAKSARRLFNGVVEEYAKRKSKYPKLARFVPAFISVHWPSMSAPGPIGYTRIRNRAARLTDEGYAEFFLASLLGYLESKNQREQGLQGKVLRARDGYYVHCVGHSFGGRFLTAAIRAAADPKSPKSLSLLRSMGPGARKVLSSASESKFSFTVDSMMVFQMAAPSTRFCGELEKLVCEAPLRGPVVLTHSIHDRANCLWHKTIERQKGIGCCGATEPHEEISRIQLGDLNYQYQRRDFATKIINVDASWAYKRSAGIEGAHSDIWYQESIHLLLSLVDFVHE